MGPLKEHYDTNWVGHLWEKEDEGTIVLALLLAGHGEGYIGLYQVLLCLPTRQIRQEMRGRFIDTATCPEQALVFYVHGLHIRLPQS